MVSAATYNTELKNDYGCRGFFMNILTWLVLGEYTSHMNILTMYQAVNTFPGLNVSYMYSWQVFTSFPQALLRAFTYSLV